MTLGRILFFLLFVAACIYGVRHLTQEAPQDRSIARLANVLDPVLFDRTLPQAKAEENLWILLSVAWDVQRTNTGKDAFDMREALRTAAVRAGMSAPESELVADMVKDNLAVCRRCRALDAPADLTAALAGKAPTVRAGIYTGERLRPSPVVPVQYAWRALHHPGNLYVMPESAALLNAIPDTTDRMTRTADRLRRADLMERHELNALTRLRGQLVK